MSNIETTNNKQQAVPKIYGSICDIMSEVGAIGKNKHNQQQKFNYRGIDDVMNALQPIMIKYRVFAVPEVLAENREERQTQRGGNLIYTILKVKYTFYADDGSNIAAIVTGEGMDSGDKSANKAMSIAFKYACFQVFCIPTEEMIDPDSDTPPHSTPVQQPSTDITQQGMGRIIATLKTLADDEKQQKLLLLHTLKQWQLQSMKQLKESDVDTFIHDLQAARNAQNAQPEEITV